MLLYIMSLNNKYLKYKNKYLKSKYLFGGLPPNDNNSQAAADGDNEIRADDPGSGQPLSRNHLTYASREAVKIHMASLKTNPLYQNISFSADTNTITFYHSEFGLIINIKLTDYFPEVGPTITTVDKDGVEEDISSIVTYIPYATPLKNYLDKIFDHHKFKPFGVH